MTNFNSTKGNIIATSLYAFTVGILITVVAYIVPIFASSPLALSAQRIGIAIIASLIGMATGLLLGKQAQHNIKKNGIPTLDRFSKALLFRSWWGLAYYLLPSLYIKILSLLLSLAVLVFLISLILESSPIYLLFIFLFGFLGALTMGLQAQLIIFGITVSQSQYLKPQPTKKQTAEYFSLIVPAALWFAINYSLILQIGLKFLANSSSWFKVTAMPLYFYAVGYTITLFVYVLVRKKNPEFASNFLNKSLVFSLAGPILVIIIWGIRNFSNGQFNY